MAQKTNKKDTVTPEDDIAAELLLKDADEALRQEKVEDLWKEWGATVIGAALMIIFGTMLGVGWQNWQGSIHKAETKKLFAAQQEGFSNVSAGLFALSSPYDAISKANAASALLNAQDELPSTELATTIHNLMVDATDAGLPYHYDRLAEWAVLRTQVDAEKDANTPIIAGKMLDLAEKRHNPYTPLIMVEAAILFASDNDYNQALSILRSALTHEYTVTIPALSERINDLVQLYEFDVLNRNTPLSKTE